MRLIDSIKKATTFCLQELSKAANNNKDINS